MRRNRFAWMFAAAAALVIAGCGSEQEEIVLSQAQEAEVAERLAPVGEVVMQGDAATAAPAEATGSASGSAERSPADIYNAYCTTCHSIGLAGAPKTGAAGDWEPRIAQGMDVVYQHAITGLRGMPPRGLCMDCSDEEIQATTDWMIEQN